MNRYLDGYTEREKKEDEWMDGWTDEKKETQMKDKETKLIAREISAICKISTSLSKKYMATLIPAGTSTSRP